MHVADILTELRSLSADGALKHDELPPERRRLSAKAETTVLRNAQYSTANALAQPVGAG